MQYLNFPPGYLQIAFGKNGLQAISFSPQKQKDASELMTLEKKKLLSQLRKYFCRRRITFKVKIDWQNVSPFTRKVLAVTQQIPYGEVSSYREIAEKLGRKQAARAVGQALAKNPMPIVIPCHRVIKSDGSLGGFAWGQKWKQRLLVLEGWKIVEGKLSH